MIEILEKTITQSIYKLQLLQQEYQFILAKHPADITVDEYNWMLLALQPIPVYLQNMLKHKDYETTLVMWYHHAQLIEKYCNLRHLPLSNEFINAKNELYVQTQQHINGATN